MQYILLYLVVQYIMRNLLVVQTISETNKQYSHSSNLGVPITYSDSYDVYVENRRTKYHDERFISVVSALRERESRVDWTKNGRENDDKTDEWLV